MPSAFLPSVTTSLHSQLPVGLGLCRDRVRALLSGATRQDFCLRVLFLSTGTGREGRCRPISLPPRLLGGTLVAALRATRPNAERAFHVDNLMSRPPPPKPWERRGSAAPTVARTASVSSGGTPVLHRAQSARGAGATTAPSRPALSRRQTAPANSSQAWGPSAGAAAQRARASASGSSRRKLPTTPDAQSGARSAPGGVGGQPVSRGTRETPTSAATSRTALSTPAGTATATSSGVSAAAAQQAAGGTGTTNGVAGYGSQGYGATGYGANAYGAGGYGASGYGAGGYGATGRYGMGGYGSGGYGGYGGGYGMGGYGMGGYGMGGYGMGYGADPSAMGVFGPQFGWLAAMQQTVGSFGMVIEMLGMNAETLHRVVAGMLHFVERVGQSCGEVLGFLAAKEEHDETGQLLPPESADAVRAERRAKLVRWAIGFFVIGVGAWAARAVFRGRVGSGGKQGSRRTPSASGGSGRGGGGPGGGSGGGNISAAWQGAGLVQSAGLAAAAAGAGFTLGSAAGGRPARLFPAPDGGVSTSMHMRSPRAPAGESQLPRELHSRASATPISREAPQRGRSGNGDIAGEASAANGEGSGSLAMRSARQSSIVLYEPERRALVDRDTPRMPTRRHIQTPIITELETIAAPVAPTTSTDTQPSRAAWPR